jgi:putative sterol carrier protein
MSDATSEFFEGLERRGHQQSLETTSGTCRFDLANGKRTERWFVSIDKGDIDVSHKSGKADCTLHAPKKLFDRVASGEVNPFAAALRGEIILEGDTRLLVRFQRLFPSPPVAAPAPRRSTSRARKR